MKKKLLALVALLVALSAPGATASYVAVTGDCAFTSITADETGPDTYTGYVVGWAIADSPGSSISVTCEVRVNGGTVDSTPPGPYGQASFTSGPVIFPAADGTVITLCAVWTGSESGEACSATSTQQIPPQAVQDLVEQVAALLADLLNQEVECVTIVTGPEPAACNSGVCLINLGTCNGGICLVNTGNCRRGCIAVVNLGRCGPRSVILP